MTHTYSLPLLLLLAVLLVGCQDDDDTILDVPTSYSFARNGQSTVSYSGQTTRLAMADELVAAMTNFDQTEAGLENMFRNTAGTNPFSTAELNASTKSIRSKVAASRDLFFTNTTEQAAIRADFDAWLTAQVREVFPNRNTLAAQGTAGQLADGSSTRYVNANGLEYNQAFGKSLIGGLMYDQLANNYLSPSVLDEGTNQADNDAGLVEEGTNYTSMEHKWDEAFGYLFGAAADGARPLDDLGAADGFLNKYLSRVDNDADYTGIAARIEEAFRTGRAAIVAGDYAERDRQAARIKEDLRKVLAVRAVYYLHQGSLALTATPVNYGGAFHDLSEGYGFIYSLRFVDGVDAATVDGWLADLTNADSGGFWTLPPATLDSLTAAIATTFNLSVAEAGN